MDSKTSHTSQVIKKKPNSLNFQHNLFQKQPWSKRGSCSTKVTGIGIECATLGWSDLITQVASKLMKLDIGHWLFSIENMLLQWVEPQWRKAKLLTLRKILRDKTQLHEAKEIRYIIYIKNKHILWAAKRRWLLDGNKEIHKTHKELPSTDCPEVCNSDTICLIKEKKLKCL